MANTKSTRNSDDAAAPLTREIVYAKTLEIADEEGIENASVRKIAAALGKTPMALYRHCDSIDDIQQGTLALAFSEVDTAPIPGELWDDTVRRTTSSIRTMYFRHSKANLFKVEASALSPGLRAHTERVQRLHREQGIPSEILERFWRIIDAFLTGFVANEAEALNALENEGGTIPEDLPEWAKTVEGAYSDQAFRDGVEIIIAGIRGLASPDPCNWRTPEEGCGE